MLPDTSSTCTLLDLSLPPIPARSRLYNLEPVGVGTGLVESQTSYVARLAQAHHVTCAVLFGYELAPIYGRSSIREKARGDNKAMILASSFSFTARAMNGTGVIARNWVETLGTATGRTELRSTTMLTWGEVVSHRRLIRGARAWCPSCYEEWRQKDRTVYEPLLWTLEAVTACPRHRRRLREICQHCRRPQFHLTSHSRPGFCSACKGWLGETSDAKPPNDERLTDTEFERQSKMTSDVEEMLAAAPHLGVKPSKEVIAHSANLCVRHATSKGTIFEFSRTHGIPKQTVANWCRGDSAPQLGVLLGFCSRARVRPLGFITGALNFTEVVREGASGPRHPRAPSAPPRPRSKIDLKATGQALRSALKEEPPPSMVGVARRIGRTSSGLKYQFPDLCRDIVSRYLRHQRVSKGTEWEEAGKALETALEDENHPSVADVARRIGWSFTRLCRRFPNKCKEISERHSQHRRVIWSRVERALKGMLKEDPPPQMRVITERLKRCETSLYDHFPGLCQRLTARHRDFRRKTFEERRERYIDDIRQAVLSLHAEGTYPSVNLVQERLKSTKSLRSSRPGLEALRQIKKEIGVEEKSLQ